MYTLIVRSITIYGTLDIKIITDSKFKVWMPLENPWDDVGDIKGTGRFLRFQQ